MSLESKKSPIKSSNNPNHNLKNQIPMSISKINSNNNLENLIFLNSIKINHPIYEISNDLLRFIPDSQLNLIKPLINKIDKNFIQKKKYSTNVDERNYLTVFEYKLNENWIIWDYSTGYVFFTGLWKACGNNKTDIVKLVENFPNLSNLVKRVRGGFLKIQGTWLPFDVVKNLAKNFCFNIRYCLIPIFGSDFPDQCLKPNDKNFGKLIDLNSQHQVNLHQHTRRRRSSNTSNNNNILKPTLKKRSKSDNFTSPSTVSKIQLIELEEILKASKSLHDLSSNQSNNNYFISNFYKSQNFQYGGFIWSWNDNNNLCIIGKENNEEAIIDDEDPISNTPVNSSSVSSTNDPSVPKNYDGIDTILNAAHQLMNFHTGVKVFDPIVDHSSTTTTSNELKKKNKMDINGLLG